MKKLTVFRRLLALTLMTGLFLVSSCGDDDGGGTPEPTQNVWEIIQNRSELSGLADAIDDAGLGGLLANSTAATVFAPTNAALNDLLGTLGIDDFDPVRDDVAEAVLAYHVVAQTLMFDQITPNSLLTTVQGESITVVDGPELSSAATSNAGFVTTDLIGTNGVVHTIDVVLVPPSIGQLILATIGTVAQPIYLAEDYSILAAAIEKADAGKAPAETIFGYMTTAPAATVFGPPNQVFDLAQIDLDTYTAEEWDVLIRSHMVGQALFPLEDAANVQTLSGLEISTFAAGSVQGPGNPSPVSFLEDPYPAQNGVVYILGGIIQP